MRTRSDLLSLLRTKDKYSNKQIRFFFLRLYGIGNGRLKFLLLFVGLNKNYSLRLLKLRKGSKYRYMDRMLNTRNILYGFLLKKRREMINNILRNIFCYRGMRRIYGKPSRGQRTHSNAATAKRFSFKVPMKRQGRYNKVNYKITRAKVGAKNLLNKRVGKKK